MRQKTTFVALFFVVASLLTAWVLHKALQAIFLAAEVQNRPLLQDRLPVSLLLGLLIAAAAGAFCFMNATLHKRVTEVFDELDKVNWPSWAETKVNTMVVIATSVIAAMILGVFDATFLNLSTWLAKVSL